MTPLTSMSWSNSHCSILTRLLESVLYWRYFFEILILLSKLSNRQIRKFYLVHPFTMTSLTSMSWSKSHWGSSFSLEGQDLHLCCFIFFRLSRALSWITLTSHFNLSKNFPVCQFTKFLRNQIVFDFSTSYPASII